MIDEIMNCLDTIEYGFKDEAGFNIHDDSKRWDDDFENFYYLLSPDELLEKRCGTCWEQVELERYLFEKDNIVTETYFICTYAQDASPCHTFLVYEDKNKYYWFEHSWYIYKGIWEYNSIKELLLDVKTKFIKDYDDLDGMTFITKYERPPYHLKCSEMYEYMENQELIRLNDENIYYIIIKNGHLMKALECGIEKEYSNYTVVYKEYKDGAYKINIDDEYLQKHMLDIIDYNEDKLILFDDFEIESFIKM